MQFRERELGLGFHPGPADQHDVISSCAQIVKQRRLADARLAPKDQNAPAARPDKISHRAEHLADRLQRRYGRILTRLPVRSRARLALAVSW
jgi:hypothetical protein